MTLRATLVLVVLSALAASPLAAQNNVYDNGPSDGQTWGWALNFGFATSNSFYYYNANNCGWGGAPCSVNGVSFAAWLVPGDVMLSAEVSITSSEFGGTTFFDQTVNFTQSGCYDNGLDFSICTETGRFPDLYLSTGTYWLNLQNALVNSGDPVWWDQNSGPSLASNSYYGTIPSESFTILGTTTTACPWCFTTPEPAGLGWLAAGLLGLLLTGSRKYL